MCSWEKPWKQFKLSVRHLTDDVWSWRRIKQHSLSYQYFLIFPSFTIPTSQEITGFNKTRISFWSCFKIFTTSPERTELSVVSLPAVCTVCNDCCDWLEFDRNGCVTAELQPRAIWHGYESETVIMNYSACVGEHLSSLALHTQKGLISVTVRVEVYNLLVMMHNRNNLEAPSQMLHSHAYESQLSLARHSAVSVRWSSLGNRSWSSQSYQCRHTHQFMGETFILLSLTEYCPLDIWVITKLFDVNCSQDLGPRLRFKG